MTDTEILNEVEKSVAGYREAMEDLDADDLPGLFTATIVFVSTLSTLMGFRTGQ